MNKPLPQLPTLVPKTAKPVESQLQRATAATINKVDTAAYQRVTVPGFGKAIPVIYGTVRTSGLYLTRPVVSGSNLVFAIGWSHGPIAGVQSVYINDADLPASGVTITHYNGGEGQAPDAVLQSALAGFNDAFTGIAYSVFSIADAAPIDGLPRVEAVIRGRLLYDPRTNKTVFSENPALFVFDFLTSKTFGPSIPVRGVEAVADRCDSLFLGEPRCRAGLMLGEPDTLANVTGVLCTYAECLWAYEEHEIILVPDAAVDAPAALLSANDIESGSLSLSATGFGRAPTSVVINYLPRSGTAAPWSQDAVLQTRPEAALGQVPEIESALNMPGIYRGLEAARKAVSRLNRLRMPGQVSWKAFDAGVRFVKGDVVQLPDIRGLTNQLVRIMDVQLHSSGRYQISAEIYDETMYADEIASDYPDSPIYEGLILPFTGDLPEGWTEFTAANGRYILGADGIDVTVGSSGGSTTAGPWTGTTSSDDLHSTRSGSGFTSDGSHAPIPPYGVAHSSDRTVEIIHAHTVTIPSFVPEVYRLAVKLMKKTGGVGELMPTNALLLGQAGIVAFGLSQIFEHNQRILMADDTHHQAGQMGAPLSSIATASAFTANHSHIIADGAPVNYQGPSISYNDNDAAGAHSHTLTTPISYDVERTTVCLYGSTYPIKIKRGMLALWDGDIGALPPGWVLADGTNGSMNVVRRFLQISADAGVHRGDNKIRAMGPVGAVPHSHKGSSRSGQVGTTGGYHGPMLHDHLVNVEIDWMPPYFALAPIQYLPEVSL